MQKQAQSRFFTYAVADGQKEKNRKNPSERPNEPYKISFHKNELFFFGEASDDANLVISQVLGLQK
jgi:hypothetical protein